MSIIGLLVLLVVAGFVVWLLNTLVQIDPKFKAAINAVIGICLFLYILQAFGIIGSSDFGHVRLR